MGSTADKRLKEQPPNLSDLSHEEKDAIIHSAALTSTGPDFCHQTESKINNNSKSISFMVNSGKKCPAISINN
jgi:hypothetical protein